MQHKILRQTTNPVIIIIVRTQLTDLGPGVVIKILQ